MILITTKQKRRRLTDLERRVVELALLSGLSNREIAETMDISYSAVACSLHRAQRVVNARSSRQGYALLTKLLNGKFRS